MSKFAALYRIELRRIWTLPKYIVFGSATLLISALALLPMLTGALEGDAKTFLPAQANVVETILSPITTIAVLFLTFGIIANDKKNHWFRSVLARPVSREHFFSAKILAVLTSMLGVMLITTVIPLLIFNITSGESLEFEFGKVLGVYSFYFLHGTLFVLIAAWLSCFVPGVFNILILALWMISESIISALVGIFLWDSKLALIFQDFYFPNGFAESSKILLATSEFATAEFLWGMTALFLFAALFFANINLINIDHSSDD